MPPKQCHQNCAVPSCRSPSIPHTTGRGGGARGRRHMPSINLAWSPLSATAAPPPTLRSAVRARCVEKGSRSPAAGAPSSEVLAGVAVRGLVYRQVRDPRCQEAAVLDSATFGWLRFLAALAILEVRGSLTVSHSIAVSRGSRRCLTCTSRNEKSASCSRLARSRACRCVASGASHAGSAGWR